MDSGSMGAHRYEVRRVLKLDDPLAGRLVAGNLTAGQAGISGYSDADWVGLDTQSRMGCLDGVAFCGIAKTWMRLLLRGKME